jgi:thiol-disulfide isomerase/thioredoxin
VSFLGRLGLAITSPRAALAVASDRAHAGRSGSDLIAAIGLLLLATQLRGLFAAGWLGTAVSPGLGLRGLMHVLTRSLTIDLGFLVVAAIVLFAAGGAKRNLGRAFDLACVAALPLVFVDLTATVVVRIAELEVPRAAGIALASASYIWAGALVALGALRPAPAPEARAIAMSRRAGWGVVALALAGTVVQSAWIAQNLEVLRPMTQGDEAPAFALPAIGPRGVLGAPVALEATRGKVTIVDFWATWCGPCLRSMPALDALAARYPNDLAVIAVNLDDAVEARALFDERKYRMALVFDDGHTSERYGVTTIPHSVVIDRGGVVRLVHRGGGATVELEVTKILAER